LRFAVAGQAKLSQPLSLLLLTLFQAELVRVESSLERNSLDYEVRIVDGKTGKEHLARKFLINEFFTCAGNFRDDIFEQQFNAFCGPYVSKKVD
jgi:hypothetical protein